MTHVTTIDPTTSTADVEKIKSLCTWIKENCDVAIGWQSLCEQSGLTHNELLSLFQTHKQLNPITYIRQERERKKFSLPDTTAIHKFDEIMDFTN
jgi:methylphosphotriester-DNA--protein-cysteine methyltransferase